MKSVNIMIKPASSVCNMRCKYCFYDEVAHMRCVADRGMMRAEVLDAMLCNIRADLSVGDRVCFAFQGGEPTIVGLEFFRQFVEKTGQWEGISVTYALQTNGVLIDDDWCVFLKQHNFLVGISCDLLPESHNEARVTVSGEGTYKAVVAAMELLKKHQVEFNVLCTLTNFIARHPEKVWRQLEKLQIDYVQFTPCMDFMQASSPYALSPQRFASFYNALFDFWYRAYQKGEYRSVKLFDDVVNLMILGRPTLCGMDGKCRPQLVIEGDGSAYPCDFYCVDTYKLGDLTRQTLSEILQSPTVDVFLNREPRALSSACEMCKYKSFCGGNCKRMRDEICVDEKTGFCGYKAFLDKCAPTLHALANKQRMNMLKRRG